MALYRKYRPASFAEVVGQEHVTDPLSVALSSGRINHAYLFSGPRGCGKTSSARILARSLNCEQGPTATPCGVCNSCEALAPGGSGTLDVTELDAASHGGVDDTRELRERAFFAPASSRYRVLIIDEAHMVTNAGFNALLKIVEEPPEHLIFIFATTEPDKVLPTIRSRTHHYPFRLLTPSSMRGLVERICEQEGVHVEPTVFPLVIRSGGGSPRDTLSVLDQLMAGAGDEGITYPRAVSLLGATEVALIDDTVDALASSDGATLFRTVDKVVEAGHDPRRFAADLLQRLRDLIMVQSVPQAIERGLVDAPVEQAETMRRQAEHVGPATLARCADMVHEGMGSMRGATSPRLLLEILCAKLLLPSADDSMAALLQRVESLESGSARPAGVAPSPAGASVPATPAAAPQSAATQPAAGAPGPGQSAPAQFDPSQGAPAPSQPEGRPKFVRRSQQEEPQPAAAAAAAAPAQAPAPATVQPPVAVPPVPTQSPAPVQAYSPVPEGQPSAPESDSPATAPSPAEHSAPVAQTPTPAPEDLAPAGQSGAIAGEPQSTGVTPVQHAPTPASAVNPNADTSGAPAQSPEPWAQSPEVHESADAAASDTAEPASGVAAIPESPEVAPVSSAPASTSDDAESDPWGGAAAAAAASASSARPSEQAAPQSGDSPESKAEPASDNTSAGTEQPAAGIEAEDIRRAWPTIREAVRTRTRTVEVMLAGATVAGVDGRVIHLVHDYAPLAKRLAQPHNATVITDSVGEVVGGDWTIRCTSASAPAAAEAPAAPQGAGPGVADGPQQAERPGWERRVRDAEAGQSVGRIGGDRSPGGGYDDIPPPPEEPEPEPGEPPTAPVSEEDMVDEARSSGPQNLDHRTGEDIALALLKEHLGATPIER